MLQQEQARARPAMMGSQKLWALLENRWNSALPKVLLNPNTDLVLFAGLYQKGGVEDVQEGGLWELHTAIQQQQ